MHGRARSGCSLDACVKYRPAVLVLWRVSACQSCFTLDRCLAAFLPSASLQRDREQVLCLGAPALWQAGWVPVPATPRPWVEPFSLPSYNVMAGEEPADSDPREHTATSPLRLFFPPDTGRGSSQEMGGGLNEVGHIPALSWLASACRLDRLSLHEQPALARHKRCDKCSP